EVIQRNAPGAISAIAFTVTPVSPSVGLTVACSGMFSPLPRGRESNAHAIEPATGIPKAREPGRRHVPFTPAQRKKRAAARNLTPGGDRPGADGKAEHRRHPRRAARTVLSGLQRPSTGATRRRAWPRSSPAGWARRGCPPARWPRPPPRPAGASSLTPPARAPEEPERRPE